MIFRVLCIVSFDIIEWIKNHYIAFHSYYIINYMLMPRVASGVNEIVLRLSLVPRKRLFAAHYNKRRYIVPYDDY